MSQRSRVSARPPGLLCFLFLLISCDAHDHLMGAPFAESSCASCITEACQEALTSCTADTTCSIYLGCLGSCPLAKSGDAEPDCDLRCRAPVPSAAGTGGQAALSELLRCREQGPGSTCRSCGRPPIGARHEILNQRCGDAIFPPFDPMSTVCPVDDGPDRYDRCLQTYCCQSSEAYHRHPESADFIRCVQACPCGAGESICVSACRQKYSSILVDFQLLAICAGYYCPACDQNPCGKPTTTNLCGHCIATRCFDAQYDCARDPSCVALGDCLSVCANGPMSDNVMCQIACWQAAPMEAVARQHRLVSCWLGLCFPDCYYSNM